MTVVPEHLTPVLADSGRRALLRIGIDDDNLVDQVNDRAVSYAEARAAEMVGKRLDEDGELVDNPDARWVITDSTRDEVRRVIAKGLEDNIGTDAIADAVLGAGAFSEDRAELIARTEVGRANSAGALDGYKVARDSGVKVTQGMAAGFGPVSDLPGECGCITDTAR